MGNEVEARAQRVRDHLQRPDHPDRQLTNAKVGSTVNQTVPTPVAYDAFSVHLVRPGLGRHDHACATGGQRGGAERRRCPV